MTSTVGSHAPRLSICIPTRNMGRWIGGAVSSAVGVGAPDEVEILVMDNCSTDETERVLAEFRTVPNLRVVRTGEFLDMVGNFNRAVRASRGTWVTMLSADDELLPTYYRNLREHLARTDVAAISQTATACWEADESSIGPRTPCTFGLEDLVVAMGSSVCMTTTAFRRDLFDAVGGFAGSAGYIFDVDLFVRLVVYSGLPICALGVDGGRYFPLRGSSWQQLEEHGEATAVRQRWIDLRRGELGPEMARAAEGTVGTLARYNGLAQLGLGRRDVARRELAVSLDHARGRERLKTRGAILATRLPGRLGNTVVRMRAGSRRR